MKFLKIIIILTFVAPWHFTFAEENIEATALAVPESYSNNFNIKLNAVGLLINLGDLTAEHKVSEKLTLGGSFILGNFNTKSGSFDFDVKTIGGNLKGNWYFSGALTDSFYTSLSAGLLRFKVELNDATTDADLKFSSPYIGAIVGYAWFWKHLNLSFGVGYNHAFEDDKAEINVDGVVGKTTVRIHTKIAIETNIGWAF